MVTIFDVELLPNIKKYDVVLFGMGINNAFNSGLLYDIAVNFPEVKRVENSKSRYGDKSKYGTIFEVETEGIKFCACYMNDGGYNRGKGKEDCVRYEDLESCLKAAKKRYKGKKICSPLIGGDFYDGKGDRERIRSIFEKVFTDSDVDLYCFDQKNTVLEILKRLKETSRLYKEKQITKEEFNERRRRIFWEDENGIFKPMPENYVYEKKNKIIRVRKSFLKKD